MQTGRWVQHAQRSSDEEMWDPTAHWTNSSSSAKLGLKLLARLNVSAADD